MGILVAIALCNFYHQLSKHDKHVYCEEKNSDITRGNASEARKWKNNEV